MTFTGRKPTSSSSSSSSTGEFRNLLSVLYKSTGCPSSSGSYSVLVPWPEGVSWVLLRPTSEIFAIPPRAPEVAVHSDHQNRGYSLFLLLVQPQPRPVHSPRLVPPSRMAFL